MVQTCRTEAEIYLAGEKTRPWAIVFETAAGWQTEYLVEAESASDAAEQALAAAREKLSHYVNRQGKNPPAGLSVAGLPLWLMVKDDGTAMGYSIAL